MCGILGVLSWSKPPLDLNQVDRSLRTIYHRGPDSQKILKVDGFCTFGHSRLSIVDLSGGSQPMSTPCGRWTLTYNGEIYNYKSLRNELLNDGCSFASESDTEVLLLGLVRYGPSFVKRLNGIFAFGLWDAHRRELLLSRDHLGIKPLYVSQHAGYLIFASEQRAIKALRLGSFQLNSSALYEFFTRLSAPAGETLFSGIHDFPVATINVYGERGIVSSETYFSPAETSLGALDDTASVNHDALSDSMPQLVASSLQAAVDRQLIADVPVGIFLSGGIDSSILTACASQCESMPHNGVLQSFTYDVKDYPDEQARASQTSRILGVENVSLKISLSQYVRGLAKAAFYSGEPLAYPSAIPIMYLSGLSSENRTKVMLAGQGADELFLGYDRHTLWLSQKDRLAHLGRQELFEVLYYGGGISNKCLVSSMTRLDSESAHNSPIFEYVDKYFHLPLEALISCFDMSFRMRGLLNRDDRMCMAMGVECRLPFLDKEFLQTMLSVPTAIRAPFVQGAQKYLLQSMAGGFGLGHLLRQPKIGSPSNASVLIHNKSFLECILGRVSSPDSCANSYLDVAVCSQIICDQIRGLPRDFLVWALLSLELWFDIEFNSKHYSETWIQGFAESI